MKEDRALSNSIVFLKRVKDSGTGSGFFVKGDLIATNIHVVAGATSVSAELRDSETNCVIKKFAVEGVTAFDAKNDLVVLKVIGVGTPLPIGDSDLLQNGDFIQSIGYPNWKYKITKGPIHSIRNSDKWIRMSFKTISGNSGGPVLNGDGDVIGVAVADSPCFSFAIPVSLVKMLLAQTQEIESLSQWQEREQIRAYACLVQSIIKQKKENYEEAISHLDNAIQLNPDYILFYSGRGNVKSQLGKLKTDEGNLTEAQQHYRDAIGDYTEAIKLRPDYAASYDDRGVAKSYLGQFEIKRGNVTEAQQHYRNAVCDYTEAIKLCPDCALIYNDRADAKCHFGKSEDALGNVKASQDLYQAAILDINTAIELDSRVAIFYHTRGEIRHALGDYSAAIEDYEKARGIDPDYTDVCKDLKLAREALEQQGKGQGQD